MSLAPFDAPGRLAFWHAHHARTATTPERAAEEARATCRGLYPHQARQAPQDRPDTAPEGASLPGRPWRPLLGCCGKRERCAVCVTKETTHG